MYPIPQQRREKPKSENCEIEVKKSKLGTKIRFRGKCSREQVEYATNESKKVNSESQEQ